MSEHELWDPPRQAVAPTAVSVTQEDIYQQ